MTPTEISSLQTLAGNRAVESVLGRRDGVTLQRDDPAPAAITTLEPATATTGPATTGTTTTATQLPADQQAFMAAGQKGPRTLRPPTRLGGFTATYFPDSQRLMITLGGGVRFRNGITLNSRGRAIAAQPTAAARAAATAINRRRRADRAAAVAEWTWTADDKQTFLADFEHEVENAWSDQHQFTCSRPGWQLGASVGVDVTIHEGPKAPAEHVSITTFKIPDNLERGNLAVVNSPAGARGATRNTMTLNSRDVGLRPDNPLDMWAAFNENATTLTRAQRNWVRTIARTFRAGVGRCRRCGARVAPGARIRVTVRGDGPDPAASAQARFNAIRTEFVAAGFREPDRRLTFIDGGTGRGALFTADSGVPQVVAAHEAGHMFGLGDEYAVGGGGDITGTGGSAGSAARHHRLTEQMGVPGAVHENNDGIMSLGSIVRPQHYSTFWWALRQVTGIPEWTIGPVTPTAAPVPAAAETTTPTPTVAPPAPETTVAPPAPETTVAPPAPEPAPVVPAPPTEEPALEPAGV